jgi:hypothetical protein
MKIVPNDEEAHADPPDTFQALPPAFFAGSGQNVAQPLEDLDLRS